MSTKVVIADAGPLIALARADALPLLHALFGRVHITRTVLNEILPVDSAFPDAELLMQTLDEGWIEVMDVDSAGWQPMNPGVDAGEASAIHAACVEQEAGNAVLLIIDDRAGRSEARQYGIALMGTAAVIGMAKLYGLIPAARPLLERMTEAGYFLGQAVINAILSETGEL
jgi:predicted nucleic acid-binding protein